VKYAFVQQHATEFSTWRMCMLFRISRSGYYAWLKRPLSIRAQSNQLLDEKIVHIYKQHKERYGSPRIYKELNAQGDSCSENRVARRMRALQLQARAKRKFKVTTDSNHALPIAENVLARDFTTTSINQKWCTDISYIRTEEGWLYLAVIIDLYSRAIIGWSMQSRMTQTLVCDALKMALWRRKFPKGVILHSDRGSQYCSLAYQTLLKANGLTCSMSRRGNCWDNAIAESFFHTLKVECVYTQRYLTREKAKQRIFEYIEMYYNRIRRHSAIDSQAPFVFESLTRISA
jgi:putative transposase